MALHLPLSYADVCPQINEILSPMDVDPDLVALTFLGWGPNVLDEISLFPAVDPTHQSGQLFLPHLALEPFMAVINPDAFTEEMVNAAVNASSRQAPSVVAEWAINHISQVGTLITTLENGFVTRPRIVMYFE